MSFVIIITDNRSLNKKINGIYLTVYYKMSNENKKCIKLKS